MEPVGLPTHWSATLHGPHLWYERSISMHSLCFNTLQSARPGDCMEATVCYTCSIDLLLLPARRYASAGYSDRNVSLCLSVRLSVCPSVTRRYCVKTKKASDMISSPSGSPKTLVFRRQISSPNSKGFSQNGGFNEGSVGKIQRFLALSVYISKTVADTAKVTISDL